MRKASELPYLTYYYKCSTFLTERYLCERARAMGIPPSVILSNPHEGAVCFYRGPVELLDLSLILCSQGTWEIGEVVTGLLATKDFGEINIYTHCETFGASRLKKGTPCSRLSHPGWLFDDEKVPGLPVGEDAELAISHYVIKNGQLRHVKDTPQIFYCLDGMGGTLNLKLQTLYWIIEVVSVSGKRSLALVQGGSAGLSRPGTSALVPYKVQLPALV